MSEAPLTSFRFSCGQPRKQAANRVSAKHKINSVIANYLIQEGYQTAAEEFKKEAGMHIVNKGLSSIERRKEIKYLILRGDVAEAIRAVSIYYPTVLDTNNLLLFRLLRLNLIEMIRRHKFSSAAEDKEFLDNILRFVREKLISKVAHSMELLKELEITMSLVCFNFDGSTPAEQLKELPEELRRLFDLCLRKECYRAVNQAILDLEPTAALLPRTQPVNDISVPALDSLPLAEDLNGLDIMDEDIDDLLSFSPLPAPMVLPPVPAQEPVIKSQLEDICNLWVATELILYDKKQISQKRYFPSSLEKFLL